MPDVCVITDAVSPEFYFKAWHSYYGKHFGDQNLFVVTYDSMVKSFSDYDLGGVWGCGLYDDATRPGVISELCALLLRRYKYVIRVDTDEILIPDPRNHANLAAYMSSFDRPYVTAYGYDVIQGLDEQQLDLTRLMLVSQRKLAYPYNALNKTCITRIPLKWAPGFHFCSAYPEFNSLFLFHLKRADIDIQLAIGKAVADRAVKGSVQAYHTVPRETLVAHNNAALHAPPVSGWANFLRTEYQEEFRRKVRYITQFGGIYQGADFAPDRVLNVIPHDFAGQL